MNENVSISINISNNSSTNWWYNYCYKRRNHMQFMRHADQITTPITTTKGTAQIPPCVIQQALSHHLTDPTQQNTLANAVDLTELPSIHYSSVFVLRDIKWILIHPLLPFNINKSIPSLVFPLKLNVLPWMIYRVICKTLSRLYRWVRKNRNSLVHLAVKPWFVSHQSVLRLQTNDAEKLCIRGICKQFIHYPSCKNTVYWQSPRVPITNG